MERRIIIAGNWKMFKTNSEAISLVREIKEKVSERENLEVVVCPPFTALSVVKEELNNGSIKLGTQNCFFEDEGAYTGEISPLMLKDLGATYVIIGHSERRKYFKEDNHLLNKKLKACLKYNLKPIFCIGETLEEREEKRVEEVLREQIKGGLQSLSSDDLSSLLIAYEPVWAIGTGKVATPEEAEKAHSFIRSLIEKKFGDEIANNLSILYGGSVKPDNILSLIKEEDIDGALIGGASLKSEDFTTIINLCLSY